MDSSDMRRSIAHASIYEQHNVFALRLLSGDMDSLLRTAMMAHNLDMVEHLIFTGMVKRPDDVTGTMGAFVARCCTLARRRWLQNAVGVHPSILVLEYAPPNLWNPEKEPFSLWMQKMKN